MVVSSHKEVSIRTALCFPPRSFERKASGNDGIWRRMQRWERRVDAARRSESRGVKPSRLLRRLPVSVSCTACTPDSDCSESRLSLPFPVERKDEKAAERTPNGSHFFSVLRLLNTPICSEEQSQTQHDERQKEKRIHSEFSFFCLFPSPLSARRAYLL
ncbi:hypothetical protein TGPRC2_309130 [Toxoplasma gondii TgCatPRC2]|uniref:Uncharacterized protein n=1 Tax=Toxoplasma gondii TgCatPRC2 TaxID=1130821 RepID=A0A151HLG1_TOXGO|nr:hypothetical protein TGPRC2_309130 [Toxoplasma gondii TgCatPRC2]